MPQRLDRRRSDHPSRCDRRRECCSSCRCGRDSKGEILRDPVVNAIARAHGKSAAQVIIRWHLQKGFCVVPGSSNPAHIQENIESFTFTLSDDEMKQIAALNKEKRYFNMSYEQIKAWMGDYELWD